MQDSVANEAASPTIPRLLARRFVPMMLAYIATQAALSRWLPPGGGLLGVPSGLAPLSVWLGFCVWGASILRNLAPGGWRPLAGVLAFVLLLVGLLIVAVSVDCVANPQGCEL
jgi:hypothetical protein